MPAFMNSGSGLPMKLPCCLVRLDKDRERSFLDAMLYEDDGTRTLLHPDFPEDERTEALSDNDPRWYAKPRKEVEICVPKRPWEVLVSFYANKSGNVVVEHNIHLTFGEDEPVYHIYFQNAGKKEISIAGGGKNLALHHDETILSPWNPDDPEIQRKCKEEAIRNGDQRHLQKVQEYAAYLVKCGVDPNDAQEVADVYGDDEREGGISLSLLKMPKDVVLNWVTEQLDIIG